MNLPLHLTLARILVIPLLVVVYYFVPHIGHQMAALLFLLAAVTDWLDGYLARKNKQVTRLGAFLDPVADKLLVAASIVMLVGEHLIPLLVLPAMVIIGREIAISALREWMSELGKRTSVAVSYVGKIKTVLQMLALIVLLAYSPGQNEVILKCGAGMLFVAAALTVWSMFIYLKAAWPDLITHRS